MKMRATTTLTMIFSLLFSTQISVQASNVPSLIERSQFPLVAGMARSSLLAAAPISKIQIPINFMIEKGVPSANQRLIKEGAANFVAYFGPQLSDSSDPIQIVVFKTIAGGKELAANLASSYQSSVSTYFKVTAVDPTKFACLPMRGGTFGAKRLIFIQSPCKTTAAVRPSGDPVLPTHELTHQLQASVNNGVQCRVGGNPPWLCEGQANVIGSILAVNKGKNYWKVGRYQMWSSAISKSYPITIKDLKMMNGNSDPSHRLNLDDSSYSIGAAMSEYLIAWGGFNKSLVLNQVTTKNRNGIIGFKDAFLEVYGINLETFYRHALPYVNYVAQHPEGHASLKY